MRRGKGLRSDPAKQRAWQQRSREKALAAQVKKRNPPPRREDRRFPGARGWTRRVFTLYGYRCVVCGDPAKHGHHAVPRQKIIRADHLSDEERTELAYDARNGVPVCEGCHDLHERAHRRIPRACLPAGVVEWAIDYGFLSVIERTYPVKGAT